MSDLRDACACCNLDNLSDCQTCDHEKQTSCQGRLPSYLFDVIELAAKHFDLEETIMLSRPHVTENDEYFSMHQQAHADIMEKLNLQVDKYLPLGNQSNASELYIQFYKKLSDLFAEHNRSFKDPFFIQSRIKSELSVVGRSYSDAFTKRLPKSCRWLTIKLDCSKAATDIRRFRHLRDVRLSAYGFRLMGVRD